MLCRLCLVEPTIEVINIFDNEGLQLQIANIITKHFWFSPSKDDSISDKICCSCWSKVDSFHQFYCFVEEAQKRLINTTQSTLLPVTLDDLKKEQIYTDDSEDDRKDDWQLEDTPITKFSNDVVDKEDPLTNSNINIKDEKALQVTQIIKEDAKDLEIEQKKRKPYKKSLKQMTKETITKKTYKKRPISISDGTEDDSNKSELEKLELQKKLEEEDAHIARYVRLDCDICYQNFETFTKLKSHVKHEHKKNMGYVVCCNKKIFKKGLLLDHINYHLDPNAFTCKICGKKFNDSHNLKYHIVNRHESDESKLLKCDQCDKKFVKQGVLERHRLIHVPQEKRQFECEICKKTYASEAFLQAHQRAVHERAYDLVCDICAKKLPGKKLLEKHRLEHAGIVEPKVQCKECGSWLKNELGLRKHMVIHKEALMDIKCEICGKKTPSKGALRDHIKYSHKTERIYKCTFCDKAFKVEKQLKEHMTTHTGGALYTCSFCPKTFNSNANMYSHRKKTHPKECEEEKRKRLFPNLGCADSTAMDISSSDNNKLKQKCS